jgi:hypothetical protein
VGARSVPKLMSRSSRVLDAAFLRPETVVMSPQDVWLRVRPRTYCVDGLPEPSIELLASFLGNENSHCLRLTSNAFLKAVDVVFPTTDALDEDSTDSLDQIPAGYYVAIGLLAHENLPRDGAVATLLPTTLAMIQLLLVLDGEDPAQRSSPLSVDALIRRWNHHMSTVSDVKAKVHSLLLPERILEREGHVLMILSHFFDGKSPRQIQREGDVDDVNAARVVLRVVDVVQWNTQSF